MLRANWKQHRRAAKFSERHLKRGERPAERALANHSSAAHSADTTGMSSSVRRWPTAQPARKK